jgi:hypothetical protein
MHLGATFSTPCGQVAQKLATLNMLDKKV